MTAALLSSPTSTRRADLDWLRVGLFCGLIFYHEGLLYEPGRKAISVLLLSTHPWRMSLLFLISGAATRFMADRLPAARLTAERSLRLLPPLVFAALVLVPAQAYLALAEGAAYTGGYLDFLKDYFAAPASISASGQLPVYGHLWFVFYLWTYTVALAIGLALRPAWFLAGQRALGRIGGMALLLWPFAILSLLRIVLFPMFGLTLTFFDDWYNHLVSLGMFLLGYLAARSERFWVEIGKVRWPALLMAAAGYALYSAIGLHAHPQADQAELVDPVIGVFHEMERWGAMVALLGFGYRHLAQGAPAPRYLNGGVFTYYIVHEPAMLAAWHWLKPLNLNDGVEAALIAAVTFATCALAYEAARRVGWLGVALGQRRLGWDLLRRRRRPAREPEPSAAPAS